MCEKMTGLSDSKMFAASEEHVFEIENRLDVSDQN